MRSDLILASSPIAKESGMLACRIVLRVFLNVSDSPYEFVVHTQGFNENGGSSYVHGHYFRPDNAKSGASIQEAFEKAFKKFSEESARFIIGQCFQSTFCEGALSCYGEGVQV